MSFTDSTGTLSTLSGQVTSSGAVLSTIPDSPLQGTAGLQAGTVEVAVLLTIPASGTYDLVLWVQDQDGERSNELTTTLTVE
jgi:hypothetical protein